MLRPSMIMGATLSTNYPSGPIVSRDWRDKEGLYHVETGRHLEAEGNRRQEQQNRHDPGVVGGGDQYQPRLVQAGCDLPTDAVDRGSDPAARRPLVRGGLRQPTTRRKKSHLASLLPWVRDRKSTRLNSSHVATSYAVFCLKK